MYGESGEEISPSESERAFSHKKLWQRFVIVAAGPVFNLLFPMLLFFFVFLVLGLPKPVEIAKIGQALKAGVAQT